MDIKRIVVALGGNALGDSPREQEKCVEKAAKALVGLIKQGNEIMISHGNGPQVGMINLAFYEASKVNDRVVEMPLPECTAMSQGYVGFHLQKAIFKELRKNGMPWHVASVVTQVEVDKNDPAFSNPTKPIGSYYTKEQAEAAMSVDSTLVFKEDAGRGYRRMVASPRPVSIIEKDSILSMLNQKYIVITCGGGGVPVIKQGDGNLKSVSAVIDKDLATSKLAYAVNADYLFVLTAVDRVSINWGKPNQKDLKSMTVGEAEKYCDEGHFAPGSMLPKVKAAIEFVKSGENKKAIIASLENASKAILGESGTIITK